MTVMVPPVMALGAQLVEQLFLVGENRPAGRARYRSRRMSFFSPDDPERQANIAFALVVLGIVAVGALTIWLFYGAQF